MWEVLLFMCWFYWEEEIAPFLGRCNWRFVLPTISAAFPLQTEWKQPRERNSTAGIKQFWLGPATMWLPHVIFPKRLLHGMRLVLYTVATGSQYNKESLSAANHGVNIFHLCDCQFSLIKIHIFKHHGNISWDIFMKMLLEWLNWARESHIECEQQ